MIPEFETPRLRLRALTEGDAPALFEIFRDPDAMRYWSRPPMTSVEEAIALIREIGRQQAAETLMQWGIARRADGEVIGSCTLHRIDRGNRRAEIGYIIRRDLWGRGFASEALEALLDHAFRTLKLHRLEADIDPRNAGSIRLIERLGFALEGRLRQRYFVGDDIQDTALYGLLAPEWSAR